MKEENGMQNPEGEPIQNEGVDLGKFKSVDALLGAYKELEAEFTRRSQKLKALEGEKANAALSSVPTEENDDALYEAVTGNEGVRTRIIGDYLLSLKGVPLMAGGGAGVTAPVQKPKNIREAGALALGYLRKK